MNSPRYPDTTVRLVGEDGNVFAIIGRVAKALRRDGVAREEVEEFRRDVMDARSYDDALQRVMQWVEVE